MPLKKLLLYLKSFILITLGLSSLKSFCATKDIAPERKDIAPERFGLSPQRPVLAKIDHPQVAQYPEDFRKNFLVLPSKKGALLIPQDLINLKARPQRKKLENIKDGTLLKAVSYLVDDTPALFVGSKKESKKLAKTLPAPLKEVTVERTNKRGEKVQKTKLRTLHHTSFNDWGPVYTAGVLYKTAGKAYFHVESGKYGFDSLGALSEERQKHLEFMQALLKTAYKVESEITTKEIQVETRNPGSLLPFEKEPDECEEVILKKMLLLEIVFPDTDE